MNWNVLWMIILSRIDSHNCGLSLWLKSISLTIQMKAIGQYFPVVLFMVLYKVVLTFESVDKILKTLNFAYSRINCLLPLSHCKTWALRQFRIPSFPWLHANMKRTENKSWPVGCKELMS